MLPHRRIPTHNRTGWASNQLNEVSELFVRFSESAPKPVLDIGAAFGIASLAALATGATVIANDMEPSHLNAIAQSAPPDHASRLTLLPGRFPEELNFASASLSAVHASNVLHFLNGADLQSAFEKAADWLVPGGQLFVQSSTPWQQPFQSFLPHFDQRRSAGDPWPGWIDDTTRYSKHKKLSQIPRAIHLLDEQTLRRAAESVGLQVLRCDLYRRRDLPASLFLDGRECVALIAAK